jgi:hypothetical protein
VVVFSVEHSPPFNAKAKSEWSYTDSPLPYLYGFNRAMFFHHFLTINNSNTFEIAIFSFS